MNALASQVCGESKRTVPYLDVGKAHSTFLIGATGPFSIPKEHSTGWILAGCADNPYAVPMKWL